MDKPIIEVMDLGKKYHLPSVNESDVSKNNLIKRFQSLLPYSNTKEVWALRHINFQVKRGDIVALTGGNGSGKSTLFRLLSEITDPSEGQITLRGKVSSILEVGVGFHLELTGKENIYLNGTLLGMTRSEIDKSFDQIVSFSELEKYLDVPVKKYSSGMYVRLAFAVASFLKSDILLVDEVLSVGDESFRKKSIQRMKHLADEGRTIIIVSHDEEILKSLCRSAIHIEKGNLKSMGSIEDVLK